MNLFYEDGLHLIKEGNELLAKGIMIFYKLRDSWNYMPPILVSSSAKHIARQILVIAKLSGTKDFIWEALFVISTSQQGITCSKLSTETREKGVKTVQN